MLGGLNLAHIRALWGVEAGCWGGGGGGGGIVITHILSEMPPIGRIFFAFNGNLEYIW